MAVNGIARRVGAFCSEVPGKLFSWCFSSPVEQYLRHAGGSVAGRRIFAGGQFAPMRGTPITRPRCRPYRRHLPLSWRFHQPQTRVRLSGSTGLTALSASLAQKAAIMARCRTYVAKTIASSVAPMPNESSTA
ncbi:hypothetical protein KCP73_08485 [Salmonella enterica subsp. enterica]|nr:hypothetical protein KCP73_08485 [Salmonella enterica subsp. enterica]